MITKSKFKMLFIFMAIMLIINSISSSGQDWAQWRGPQRDGVLMQKDLNLDWSAKKPTLLWSFKQAGAGYSSPSIVGTTLYCQGASEDNDFAFALDTKTGNIKWKQTLGDEYVQNDNRGNGPRGAVTVDGDKLYLIRGGGQIVCLSAADGKIIWQKDFKNDFNGKLMSNWGFSESPLIDGNHVICTPGGSDGTIMALDKNTGAIVWATKELTDASGHSSAIVAEVNGVRQYIQQTSKGVVGVSAKDGKLLWKVDIAGYRTAVIPTPVYFDNMVYVTNGYQAGCTLVKLTKDGNIFNAETVYSNKNLENQHGGVVLMNGYIYGFCERPTSSWICQNLTTGETVWSHKPEDDGVAKGAVLGVNDRLLLLDEQTGTIAVAAASPDGWKEFGRLPIPARTEISSNPDCVWTHPVIADGKLYVRDKDLLFCFDLKN